MAIKSLRRNAGSADHLAALSILLQDSQSDAARLFEQGLAMLVQSLRIDQAMLTRVTPLGHEVLWWASGPRSPLKGIFESPDKGFCPFLLGHPDRPLIIKDAATESRWRKSPGHLELGIRSYAGVALMVGDQAHGTLCVQDHRPRVFTRAELALVMTMGQLMARTLESESLKQELQSALNALELSSAVVEDSALISMRSSLPNRRYLEIWLRSALFLARRRKEPMALALWSQPMVAGTKSRLGAASAHLRGEDLLLELSPDQYLLLMPHTSETGAEILLTRLRESLGTHPTGATLWLADGKDMTMKSALRRVAKAFTDANRTKVQLHWSLS